MKGGDKSETKVGEKGNPEKAQSGSDIGEIVQNPASAQTYPDNPQGADT